VSRNRSALNVSKVPKRNRPPLVESGRVGLLLAGDTPCRAFTRYAAGHIVDFNRSSRPTIRSKSAQIIRAKLVTYGSIGRPSRVK
jgi:hypothetical protein